MCDYYDFGLTFFPLFRGHFKGLRWVEVGTLRNITKMDEQNSFLHHTL